VFKGGIIQEGELCLNDTVYFAVNTVWKGEAVATGMSCPQFVVECAPPIYLPTANPGVVLEGTANIDRVSFIPSNNAYIDVWSTGNGLPAYTIDNSNFAGTSNDYMGVALYTFCPPSEAAGVSLHRDLFSSGIPQIDGSTATPLVIFKNCGLINSEDLMFVRRGAFVGGNGANASFNSYEFSGGITPAVTLGGNTASAGFSGALDTMSHAAIANLGGSANNNAYIGGSGAPSNGFGVVTGNPFASVSQNAILPTAVGQNVSTESFASGFIYDGLLSPNGYTGQQSVHFVREHVDLGAANTLFTDPGPAPAPTCRVSSGGPPYSMSAHGGGTYSFAYSAIYPSGGWGPTSAIVNCTMDGKSQQATLTAPTIPGAVQFFWYFGFNHSLGNAITSGPLTQSIVVPSCSTGCAGFSNTSAAGSGPVGIRGPLMWATQLKTGSESTMSQCFSSASPAICGSNIDGFVAIPAGSSSVVVETTAVTAKSEISLTFDTTQGKNLGVTCNSVPQQPYISARATGRSFTISVPSSFSRNPGCIGFHLRN
jgi:hypothetical protein